MVTVVRCEQAEKTLSLIDVKLLGMAIEDKLLQLAKAPSPMVVTLLGMSIVCSFVQFAKAFSLIEVRCLGKVTEESL